MGDQLSVVERLTGAVAAHEKTVAFGNSFYGTKRHLDLMSEAAAEILSLQEQLARAETALRNIAEGNLGDRPWQANYDRIREVARSTLSPEPLVTPEPPCPHLSEEDWAIVSQQAVTLALGCDHRMRGGQCERCGGWANG